MSANAFRESLRNPDQLTVLVEFTCPAGQTPDRLLKFLKDYETKPPEWPDAALAGITVTHNPSGVVTALPSDVYAHVRQRGGLRGLSFIPHVSAKGMNRAELESFVRGLASHGVEDCFVVTGDKPLVGRSVFELDSLNLLRLILKMNADARVAAGTDGLAMDLRMGAGVGLAKYEEGTCWQQMLKVEKKIRFGGAAYIITNLIYDPRKVEDFFRYLRERALDVPVIGNVFFLTGPAARRMRHEKLPGCFVSEALYARVTSESREQWIDRCAQLVAMWRGLGAAGVDLGNVEDLGLAREILDRARAIGGAWREHYDNLSFPPERNDRFYLYDKDGNPSPPRTPRVPWRRRVLRRTHDRFFEPGRLGYKAARALIAQSRGIREGRGLLFEALCCYEHLMKRAIAQCRACGDCYLPENQFVCTVGECTKGLTNVPCADSTADGMCGVDPLKPCAGRQVYDAARFFQGSIEPLRQQVNPPKNPDLIQTSSFRNFFLQQDHRRRNPLTIVGELLHTTIPKVKRAFERIKEDGATFAPDNPGVAFLRAAVESQVLKGADFLDCNVDDAGGGDQALACRLMEGAVGLIVAHGCGTPPCVDSSDMEVIKAGLKEYFRLAPVGARTPMVNSANQENLERLWALCHIGQFKIVYMLMESSLSANAVGQYVKPEEMLAGALEFYHAALRNGFRSEDILFDTTVMPLAVEFSCFDRPGYSWCSFEAMRLIRQHPQLQQCGAVLGISNLTRDFPSGRKIGILRAYVHLAMQRGLTAAIVDVEKDFGLKPPEDDEIVEIVRAFVEHDGTPESYQRMQEAYGRYRSFAAAKP